MRRAYLAVLAVGALALLVTALTRSSTLVYSPGIPSADPSATLHAGQVVCQGPLTVPAGARFDRVGLAPTAPGARGAVMVNVSGGRRLGKGRLTGTDTAAAAVGRVRPESALEICVRAAGPTPLTLLGAGGTLDPATEARLDGVPIPNDIALRFEAGPRSLLALAPAMAERAARFRPGGPWLYLFLAGLVLLGVPALLLRALREAGAPVP